MEAFPNDLIINWDQTATDYVLISDWTKEMREKTSSNY